MYTIGLQALRAKIRGFHVAGSTFSSRIGKAKREKKERLWNLKRALGNECRSHLIAYGLLRGVPYHEIERCAPNNRPNAREVLSIMLAHNTGFPGVPVRAYDLAAVEQLLESAPTMAQEKAA